MNAIPCEPAGFVSKTFGNKGQLVLVLNSDIEIQEGVPVFLIIDGKPVPFFIKSAEEKNYREWLVELDDITNPDSAKSLCGKEVALEKKRTDVVPPEEENIIGFTVKDKKAGVIGLVAEIMFLPMHDIMVVSDAKREILIPINEEIVLKINLRKKLIEINAPEGLLDLNQ